jgi:opacity protein-like surface antigen
MRSVKFLLTAAAVSFSTMAFASDLPIAAPPVYAPPADFGGWYLRGDIGMTNQGLSRIDSKSASLFPQTAQLVRGFGGSLLSSLGVGYQANNLLRAEAAHAGLAYRVTPSVTLELAYSYSISDPPGPEHLPRSMERPGPPRLCSRASPPMT